jgi:hypothetical protein
VATPGPPRGRIEELLRHTYIKKLPSMFPESLAARGAVS